MSSTDMTSMNTHASADTSTGPAGAGPAAGAGDPDRFDSNRVDSNHDAIRNGPGPVPEPGQCKRPGCQAPLPAPGPGRSRVYCSDWCRHQHNNKLRRQRLVPPPGRPAASRARQRRWPGWAS